MTRPRRNRPDHRRPADGEDPDRDRRDRLRHSWDRNAGAWAEAVRTRALESRRLVTDEAMVAAVLEHGGGAILDAGCGEGWLARRLAAAGRRVVGFDGSAELIDRARREGGGEFHVLDYGAFAADPARLGDGFDAATCNFSILGDDIGPLLRSLRSVVRPGGRLVVQTVHPFSEDTEPYEDGWREERFDPLPGEWTAMPWYFRTLGSWTSELRAAGWWLEVCEEPQHPTTKRPASLIMVTARLD